MTWIRRGPSCYFCGKVGHIQLSCYMKADLIREIKLEITHEIDININWRKSLPRHEEPTQLKQQPQPPPIEVIAEESQPPPKEVIAEESQPKAAKEAIEISQPLAEKIPPPDSDKQKEFDILVEKEVKIMEEQGLEVTKNRLSKIKRRVGRQMNRQEENSPPSASKDQVQPISTATDQPEILNYHQLQARGIPYMGTLFVNPAPTPEASSYLHPGPMDIERWFAELEHENPNNTTTARESTVLQKKPKRKRTLHHL